MHTWTLVKTHEADAKSAEIIVEDLMMDTIWGDKKFDYVGSCRVITMTEKDKKELEVETLEELEAKYKAYTTNNLESTKRRVREELHLLLIPLFLSNEEAALMINHDDRRIQHAAQESLKIGGEKDLPKSLDELVSKVSDALITSTSGGGNPLPYHLRCLEAINDALAYPEDFYTCASTPDCHFIDRTLGEDQDESLPIFYVLVDRHY